MLWRSLDLRVAKTPVKKEYGRGIHSITYQVQYVINRTRPLHVFVKLTKQNTVRAEHMMLGCLFTRRQVKMNHILQIYKKLEEKM